MIPCIIPARGGSKGFPGKNIALLGGKPLLAWSVDAARESESVDRVIVATDDREIANVARDHGAQVHWRSDESATDEAPSEQVLLEVICEHVLDLCPVIVFLQPTSPLRPAGLIDDAIDRMIERKADSLFTCRHVEGYTWRSAGDEVMPNYLRRLPRQFRESSTYEENGSLYLFRPWVILQTGSRLGGKIAHYQMDPLDSFQVDEEADLRLMESILEVRHDRRSAAAV